MLLLPWFVCCFAEPSEVSPFFLFQNSSFREDCFRHLLGSCLSWLPLPGCMLCSAPGGNTTPFFRALYHGSFYAWPHIWQHTAFMAVPPHKAASWQGILRGFGGFGKHRLSCTPPGSPRMFQFFSCLQHPLPAVLPSREEPGGMRCPTWTGGVVSCWLHGSEPGTICHPHSLGAPEALPLCSMRCALAQECVHST